MFLNRSDQKHVRRIRVHLEEILYALTQDRRRERAEGFAEFNLKIHLRLHTGRAGVAQNTSCAKSARTKLHAPLKPADDLLFCQQARNRFGQLLTLNAAESRARRLKKRSYILARKRWTEICSLHPVRMFTTNRAHVSLIFQILIPDRERSARCSASIARRRLNPDILKRSFTKDSSIDRKSVV